MRCKEFIAWCWWMSAFGMCHVHYQRSHFTHPLEELDPSSHGIVRNYQVPRECGYPAQCVLPVQCPAHVTLAERIKVCNLQTGTMGICCVSGESQTRTKSGPYLQTSLSTFANNALPGISTYLTPNAHLVHDLIDVAQTTLKEIREKQKLLRGEFIHVNRSSPAYGHFLSTRHRKLPRREALVNLAVEAIFATMTFLNRKNRDGWADLELLHPDMKLKGCSEPITCDKRYPYRKIDGSCNNLGHPQWGAAFTAMRKILHPAYADGVWAPRVSVIQDTQLPSPRLLSSQLFPDLDLPHHKLTLMHMQFGQFISHDIMLTTTFDIDGHTIQCCDEKGSHLPDDALHFGCLPISVQTDDPFYKYFNKTCLNFVRNELAPRSDTCSTMGYATQMNSESHTVDGSGIYGTCAEDLQELRLFKGGRLRMFNDFGRELLPLNNKSDTCIEKEAGSACFKGGDPRLNQQIGLVVINLLFTREHNRLAEALSALNPHWDDERLFQEARQILVAEIQHILYTEYLPALIGERAMADYGLKIKTEGYSDYDPQLSPSISSEFSAAAFRYGHSTVDGRIMIAKASFVTEIIDLPELMFNPARMRLREFYDRYLISLTSQPMQRVDTSVTEGLSGHLFRGGNPFGTDLVAINIQRGRDHGLPGYNAYRELVGFQRANSFSEFGDLISKEAIEMLRQIYASPDDVDLYVGGLMEHHSPGAIIGPTFQALIAEQFSRLKKGDRFFYEHGHLPTSFSQDQLREIKKVTMARIVCDNSDGIELKKQSLNAFVIPEGNNLFDCNHYLIPRVDVRFWQENR